MQELYKTANLTYRQTIHRITPYLIGIGLGYFLCKFRRNIHVNSVSKHPVIIITIKRINLS